MGLFQHSDLSTALPFCWIRDRGFEGLSHSYCRAKRLEILSWPSESHGCSVTPQTVESPPIINEYVSYVVCSAVGIIVRESRKVYFLL